MQEPSTLKSGVLAWREADSKQWKSYTFNLIDNGDFVVYSGTDKVIFELFTFLSLSHLFFFF